ncbi:hypothetical protein [Pseudomonas sp. R5(2019)]|uniref:hypothetical protein n=1 Tax=Pseudomonas sp. R5(2019) TaxID=2697566 RepID=UPI001411BA69|nr:hypothetical protein [Pseudomonas sp. R5(2019)]NBA95660.1 hypothetical protein [Pseudomonas sp. R5(2019)]
MDDENLPIGCLEIAGLDVSNLLWEQDDIELAVRELALYSPFREHFKEALELANYATSFWLEDGRYPDRAGSVVATMFRLRDEIEEHASYADAGSLPSVARRFISIDRDAADSQLVATYALVQSIQAVQVLANWLFETELYVFDLDADLIAQMQTTDPKKYCALAEKERQKDPGGEIDARESFRAFMGDADKALMLASLYRQVEDMDVSKGNFNVASFLSEALGRAFSAKASQRGAAAGKANRNPESVKQQDVANLFERVRKAADRHILANPTISELDLKKALVKKERIASEPTVKKYLILGGYLPR